MNKNQIKFTCEQLGLSDDKTNAIVDVMTGQTIPSLAEFTYSLPKNTVSRDVNRVQKKWREMQEVSKVIPTLDYAYEPAVLDEDIARAAACLHEAIEQIDSYKEGDFNTIEELKSKALEEVNDALNSEFKNV